MQRATEMYAHRPAVDAPLQSERLHPVVYRSFGDFALHLHTNTIGPILIAQKLLKISGDAPPKKIVFISSDSGSAARFRDHEDGFGAYAASKAALNQMLRHM